MTTSPDDPKNDIVFLGINFNNFFKNCGCLNRLRTDNESVSSYDGDKAYLIRPERQNKMVEETPGKETAANGLNEETHSIASSADWADLEEVSFPADPYLGNPVFDNSENNGNPLEDYTTQEPIDFEHLKELTGIKKEEDDAASQKSQLSRSSKKIGKDLYQNQTHMSRFAKANAIKEEVLKGKRKPWQPHEDAKVLELVARYGQSWAVVASMMDGRTGKQIRDRYLNKLRPNIKKGEWSNEEDRLLLSLYYQIGHKWSKIATFLPGRTEGQVKNRFYSHIKKKILTQEGGEGLESPDAHLHAMYQNGQGMGYTNGRNATYQDYGAQGNVDDYIKSMPSPAGSNSTHTTTTQASRVQSDAEVNKLLDKMVGYVDTKGGAYSEPGIDLDRLKIEEGNMDNLERLDRFEELQKRKNKLELLLAQTMKDMGTLNPQNMSDV